MAEIWITQAVIWHVVLSFLFLSTLAFETDVGKMDWERVMNMEGCEHMTPEGEERDLEWQALQYGDEQERMIVDDDLRILPHLDFRDGRYVMEGVELNATRKDWSSGLPKSVTANNQYSVSRTAYRDVYIVMMSLHFRDESVQYKAQRSDYNGLGILSHLGMFTEFQGVYSKKTGQLCATLCVGGCSGNSTLQQRTPLTPSQFVYRSTPSHLNFSEDEAVASDYRVHIELKYPRSKTITTPFVHGMMTSLRPQEDPLYFHPFQISAVSQADYEFNESVQAEAKSIADMVKPDISAPAGENRPVWSLRPLICPSRDDVTITGRFSVLWNSSCGSNSSYRCSPFSSWNEYSEDWHTGYMSIDNVKCSSSAGWKISAEFNFRSPFSYGYQTSHSVSNFLLVGEGYWNFYKPGQLVMLAYYFGSDGTKPVDTRILITLQIPLFRTIHHRHSLIGHVRSLREESDSLHFNSIAFVTDTLDESFQFYEEEATGPKKHAKGKRWCTKFEVKYVYDESITSKLNSACNFPGNSTTLTNYPKHAKFPSPAAADYSQWDDLSIRTFLGGSTTLIYLNLFTIEDVVRQNFGWRSSYQEESSTKDANDQTYDFPTGIPISFNGFVSPYHHGENTGPLWTGEMETEGRYNSATGELCMLGCQKKQEVSADGLINAYENGKEEISSFESERCDIVFSLQYPPTNPKLWSKRPVLTGSITSLLNSSHPLYFKPLLINSTEPKLYREQVRSSIWRRHSETIINLASSSLLTLFIAIQVGYSTRESSFRNVRYLSLVMLIILTSGHLLPLLLIFTSSWSRVSSTVANRDFIRDWSYYSEFPWQETSQVIVQGTAIAALFLECRLLQLVLRSRARAGHPSNPDDTLKTGSSRAKDTLVLFTCLPIYLVVILVVAFVHWQQPHRQHCNYFECRSRMVPVITDVQAIFGVILDLFLLPQVIANVLWETDPKVAPLYPLFYWGVTAVRSAAHFFDAWRTQKYVPNLRYSMHYYANPNWDLYSTTGDIVIPCASISLALVLFLQQRFGGRCSIVSKQGRGNQFEHLTIIRSLINCDLG